MLIKLINPKKPWTKLNAEMDTCRTDSIFWRCKSFELRTSYCKFSQKGKKKEVSTIRSSHAWFQPCSSYKFFSNYFGIKSIQLNFSTSKMYQQKLLFLHKFNIFFTQILMPSRIIPCSIYSYAKFLLLFNMSTNQEKP